MKQRTGVLLLSIGDELLDGRTLNTNASWFGEQFRLNGVPVSEVKCVSDRLEEIVDALRYGKNFPIVIATGGLGPTNDDRTLEAAAIFFRKPLIQNPTALKLVKACYDARGLPLTDTRKKLALTPKGAKILANPTGTAPGSSFPVNKTQYFFLPGPPNECKPMFETHILPFAKKKIAEKKLIHRGFWRTFGKGESDVYALISPFVEKIEKDFPLSVTFGIHISFPCVDLTFEVWKTKGAKTPSKKQIEAFTDSIENAVSTIAFSRKRETLVEKVFQELKEKRKTLSLAESCTGGLLSKLFTDLPGSSSVFWGGVVSYDNDAKQKFLGVDPLILKTQGAVSEACVKKMAENLREKAQTDFSIAISGIAGPNGGSKEKPVGTIHVALSHKGETKTLHQVILRGQGSRDQNRIIAAHLALDLLRNALHA
jgi:nicotinamide-nucleotide amidase